MKSSTNTVNYGNIENNQTLPDPQIYNDGCAGFLWRVPERHVFRTIADAIAAAKSGDTIMLEDGQTFYEHGLTINKNLNIHVFNNGHATIDGQLLGGIFIVNPGVTLNLQNIILTNGKATNGAAILNYGILNLNGCSFTNNYATIAGGADNGGAIYNKP